MRAPINQLKHSSSFLLEFPFQTTICLGCGRSNLCTEWPEATWLFCSLPMPDLQESLQFAGSVRESSGLDTIFESGLWINDSPQEVSKQGKEQKRGEREAGVILKPQGRKKKPCQTEEYKRKENKYQNHCCYIVCHHSIQICVWILHCIQSIYFTLFLSDT